MKTLTFKEWQGRYMHVPAESVIAEMNKFHDIDANKEILKMQQFEYNKYVELNKLKD